MSRWASFRECEIALHSIFHLELTKKVSAALQLVAGIRLVAHDARCAFLVCLRSLSAADAVASFVC